MPGYQQTRGRVWHVALILLVMLAMPITSAKITGAQGGQELRVRLVNDIYDVDPARIRNTEDYSISREIYSSLVRYNSAKPGGIEPDLAERYAISKDGLIYTFWLHKGVKWHKGYGEVTAKDVKFSLDRLSDKASGSLYINQASIIDHVEVVDPYQVKVYLKQPYPGFLVELLAYRPGFIVNEKAISEFKDKYTGHPIGSGPFIFDEWQPGSKIVLKPNPDYYGQKPKVAQVTFVLIRDDSLFQVAMEKGDVDLGYFIDSDVQASIMANPKIKKLVVPAPQTIYVRINVTQKPWTDVRVRQALWYATDRPNIIKNIFQGLAQESDTLLNPSVFGYDKQIYYKYDPEKAKQLLAEAGYANGFTSDMLYYQNETWPKGAPAVQASWKAVGINVNLKLFEEAQLYEQYRAGTFDLGADGIMRVGPDQIFSILLHSKSIPLPNAMRYSDPEMDRLIDTARVENDPAKRLALYRQIQAKVRADVPVVPLYQPVFVLAMQPNIKGVVFPGVQAYVLSNVVKEKP
jgi:peptide/nickel transport system substrate-binding protein